MWEEDIRSDRSPGRICNSFVSEFVSCTKGVEDARRVMRRLKCSGDKFNDVTVEGFILCHSGWL